MEKFLTQDEKELLSLVHYHRAQYEKTKLRQGGLHPDDIEIMKMLDQAEELLKNISEQRKKSEEERNKSEMVHWKQFQRAEKNDSLWKYGVKNVP